MKALLDGKSLAADRETLAGVVEAGTARAGESGRVIVEVWVDGEVVSSELLADPPETDLTGREVLLTSAEPRGLVSETLRDASDVLGQTRQGQVECAELIQQGALEEAFQRLPRLLQEWQMVQEVLIGSARLLGEPVDELAPGGGGEEGEAGIEKAIETLGNLLQEVKGALGREDWAALSDVLAYDLNEAAGEWCDMLDGIAARVEGKGAG